MDGRTNVQYASIRAREEAGRGRDTVWRLCASTTHNALKLPRAAPEPSMQRKPWKKYSWKKSYRMPPGAPWKTWWPALATAGYWVALLRYDRVSRHLLFETALFMVVNFLSHNRHKIIKSSSYWYHVCFCTYCSASDRSGPTRLACREQGLSVAYLRPAKTPRSCSLNRLMMPIIKPPLLLIVSRSASVNFFNTWGEDSRPGARRIQVFRCGSRFCG